MQGTGPGRPAEALASPVSAVRLRTLLLHLSSLAPGGIQPKNTPKSREIAVQGAAKAAKPSAAPQADQPPPLPVRWLDFEKVGLVCTALACPRKQLPWGCPCCCSPRLELSHRHLRMVRIHELPRCESTPQA